MLLVMVGLVVLNCPCVGLAKVFRSQFGRLRGRRCRPVGWWVQDSARSRDGSFARRDQQRDWTETTR
jgi:hypothetical protein